MFLPSPCPSGRPAPRRSSFRAALLREIPSRLASCRMALSRSSSNPLIVSCFILSISMIHLMRHLDSQYRLHAQRSRNRAHIEQIYASGIEGRYQEAAPTDRIGVIK